MSQIQISGEAKIRDLQGPVVANSGVITALDGAASQYVRGDGTLADFPSQTGGGSSVSYYLNGSVNQGTFGGSTYYQMSKNAITGAGTNFSTSSNGLLAQFITDADDPDQTSIPSGNWNIEFFMGVSASSGALASFYVEFYKYNGSTFTLIATNVATPEFLTGTTSVESYFTSVAFAETPLATTDRLAIRIYANVASKTVTLYTEDNRLCQVVTTFSRGILSLNNLTDQQQYFAVGTSGTDFNIVSSLDTHTFNIPSASATNRGLITTGTQTIAGQKTFEAPTYLNNFAVFADGFSLFNGAGTSTLSGPDYTGIIASKSGSFTDIQIKHYLPYISTLRFSNDVADYTYTFPNITGTLALLEGNQTFLGDKTFDGISNFNTTIFNSLQNNFNYGLQVAKQNTLATQAGYMTISSVAGTASTLKISDGNSSTNTIFTFDTTGSRNYTFPAASGTIALTSNLSSYVPYTGATGPVNLGAYDLTVNGLTIGKGGGALSSNTAIGSEALSVNTTGIVNTALGNQSLRLNTTGSSNTALGSTSLAINTTGSFNTTIGSTSGSAIITGSYNTIVGNYTGTSTMASNVILADGQGNMRFQWDGTYVKLTGTVRTSSNVLVDGGNILLKQGVGSSSASGYIAIAGTTGTGVEGFVIGLGGGTNLGLLFPTSSNYSYIFPAATGTLALTSNIPSVSGTSGQVTYFNGTSSVTGSSNHFWDATNNRLGIGLTNPQRSLEIYSATADSHLRLSGSAPSVSMGEAITGSVYQAKFGLATAAGQYVSGAVAGDFVMLSQTGATIFATSATEKARITSGGNLLVGTTSDNGSKLQISGAATFSSSVTATTATFNGFAINANPTNNGTGASFTRYLNTGGDFYMGLENSSGSFFGASAYANVMYMGSTNLEMFWSGSRKVTFTSGGRVGIGQTSPGTALSVAGQTENWQLALTSVTGTAGAVIGSPSANVLAFGDWSGTERMRITSGGALLVGTTSALAGSSPPLVTYGVSAGPSFVNADSGQQSLLLWNKGTSGNNLFTEFHTESSLTIRGSIYFSRGTGLVIYATSSDYRLKSEIEDFNALEILNKLNPKKFKIGNSELKSYGFIAHELQEYLPQAVIGEKDEIKEDGTPKYQQVDYSQLSGLSTKAIQELYKLVKEQQAQIELLSNKIVALESK